MNHPRVRRLPSALVSHGVVACVPYPLMLIAVVVLAAACSAPERDSAAASGFTIEAVDDAGRVTRRAASVDVPLAVTAVREEGHASAIDVAAGDLPAGVTAEPVVVPPEATTADLTLQVGPDAALGRDSVELRASDGTTTDSASVSLFVADPSGTLDETFGRDGLLVRDIPGGILTSHEIVAQQDGKVVLTGILRTPEDARFWVIGRFEHDGTLDTSFGTGGWTTVETVDGLYAGDVVLRDQGFLATFMDYIDDGGGLSHDTHVVAFDTEGRVDASFGDQGVVTLEPRPKTDLRSLAVLSDGRILVGGDTSAGLDAWFSVARLHTDGTLDTSFGDAGFASIAMSEDVANDLAVMPDGGIVIVGRADTPDGFDFAVARFGPDGSPDTDFGGAGTGAVSYDFAGGTDEAFAVEPQGDKIIVAGGNVAFTEPYPLASILRLNSDGTLDTTFHDDGKAQHDFGTGPDNFVALALQDDGKIVAAGTSYGERSSRVILARFDPNGHLDTASAGTPFTASGFVLGPAVDGQYPVTEDMTLLPEARIVTVGSVYDDADPDGYPFFLMRHWE